MSTLPTLEPDSAGDERTLLVQFLDRQRETIVHKARGLDARGTAAQLAPSTLTLGGLVKHLTFVEQIWFDHRFAGAEPAEPWASVDWDADPDWEFTTGATEPIEDLLAAYLETCARGNALVEATADLGQLSAREVGTRGHVSLRWILLHMIEETARHAGHADLIRESVDGAVGY